MRKKEIGTKHLRKLKRYSDKFNEIFNFFLNSYRKKILTFCGSEVRVLFDKESPESKEIYRLYENGNYQQNKPMFSRQNNVLEAVIIAKKSWGLHVSEWTDGINEWCLTPEEVIQQFTDVGITIPEPLLKDFYNTIERKRQKRLQKLCETMNV